MKRYIWMGEEYEQRDDGNVVFYEDVEKLVEINREMLKQLGQDYITIYAHAPHKKQALEDIELLIQRVEEAGYEM